jgi:molybdenum cofactor cytidylyltransferase
MVAMPTSTGTIILAAGAATRMGFPKQLLEYQGETLVHRITRICLDLSVGPVVVVSGAHRAQVVEAIHDLEVEIAFNANWETGMGSSIRCGLHHLLSQAPDLQHLLIVLVDQPFVNQNQLQEMLSTYESERPLLLVSQYASTIGVPAIFAAPLFSELKDLDGQKGAKRVLEKYKEEALKLDFPKGKIDLDTPSDWERFLNDQTS